MSDRDEMKWFNEIVDTVESRCMAIDGPVTPTLQEMRETELAELWRIVQRLQRGWRHDEPVLVDMATGNMTCHTKRDDCEREEPHPIAECGAFAPEDSPKLHSAGASYHNWGEMVEELDAREQKESSEKIREHYTSKSYMYGSIIVGHIVELCDLIDAERKKHRPKLSDS